MTGRYWLAMGSYAAIATLAWLTLDGDVRTVVWIVMAGLALKTWIARRQQS
jgi:hypothetical protein